MSQQIPYCWECCAVWNVYLVKFHINKSTKQGYYELFPVLLLLTFFLLNGNCHHLHCIRNASIVFPWFTCGGRKLQEMQVLMVNSSSIFWTSLIKERRNKYSLSSIPKFTSVTNCNYKVNDNKIQQKLRLIKFLTLRKIFRIPPCSGSSPLIPYPSWSHKEAPSPPNPKNYSPIWFYF